MSALTNNYYTHTHTCVIYESFKDREILYVTTDYWTSKWVLKCSLVSSGSSLKHTYSIIGQPVPMRAG